MNACTGSRASDVSEGRIATVVQTRGEFVETRHRAHIVVVNDSGVRHELVFGDTTHVWPIRSLAKPFQVIPLIELGGVSAFGFDGPELALLCASHNGERRHIELLLSLLQRLSVEASELQCGVHPPFYEWITRDLLFHEHILPSPLHNNCSGSHLAQILTARLLHQPISGYRMLSGRVQGVMRECICDVLGIAEVPVAPDDCGVPTYCVSLEAIARGYLGLASAQVNGNAPHSGALARVRRAMMENPYIVGGRSRLETLLMERLPVVAKSGAAGLFAIGIPEKSLAIVVKVETGVAECCEYVVLEILRRLDIIDEGTASDIARGVGLILTDQHDVVSGRYYFQSIPAE